MPKCLTNLIAVFPIFRMCNLRQAQTTTIWTRLVRSDKNFTPRVRIADAASQSALKAGQAALEKYMAPAWRAGELMVAWGWARIYDNCHAQIVGQWSLSRDQGRRSRRNNR